MTTKQMLFSALMLGATSNIGLATDAKEMLHKALRNLERDRISELIKNGADVNEKDRFNQTPAHIAAKECNLQALRLLAKNGADLDLQDNHGETPLTTRTALTDIREFNDYRIAYQATNNFLEKYKRELELIKIKEKLFIELNEEQLTKLRQKQLFRKQELIEYIKG